MFDLSEFTFVGKRITLLDGKTMVTEECVREEGSVLPHITYVFAIRRASRQKVHEFIRTRETKKWIIFLKSRQEFIELS